MYKRIISVFLILVLVCSVVCVSNPAQAKGPFEVTYTEELKETDGGYMHQYNFFLQSHCGSYYFVFHKKEVHKVTEEPIQFSYDYQLDLSDFADDSEVQFVQDDEGIFEYLMPFYKTEREANDFPKQYIKVNKKKNLEYALKPFKALYVKIKVKGFEVKYIKTKIREYKTGDTVWKF